MEFVPRPVSHARSVTTCVWILIQLVLPNDVDMRIGQHSKMYFLLPLVFCLQTVVLEFFWWFDCWEHFILHLALRIPFMPICLFL
jgi:hypothetical protein